MTSSSLYAMKYLSEFFCTIRFFFETDILVKSMSSDLNSFFVFVKIAFAHFFVFKIYALSTHSYTW